MRTPHLRDLVADSRGEAFRLADLLVHSAAQDLGVRLAEPTPRVPVSLDFTGVPDPDAFRAELHTMVDAKDSADVESGPEALADGAQMSVTGRAHDAAMIIARSLVGGCPRADCLTLVLQSCGRINQINCHVSPPNVPGG